MEENWHWRIVDNDSNTMFNKLPFALQGDAVDDLIATLAPMTTSARRRLTMRGLLVALIIFVALWLVSDLAIRLAAVMFFVRSNADVSPVVAAILATVGAVSGFPAVLRWLSTDALVSTLSRR